MKTIVVSAVNIRKGGTLTILRGCLEYLSQLAKNSNYRIVALVHNKDLAYYDDIEYIEKPATIKSWSRRIWCEYITMRKISKRLAPVDLWLSLHDTTPFVIARKQAVYCQTSFPFLKLKKKDLLFDYKIVLFSLFTKYAYRINIKRNNALIVQADWLRKGFSKMFKIPEQSFIVSPPENNNSQINNNTNSESRNNPFYRNFIFASTPDCHKNFELICKASQLLEKEIGQNMFKVVLTISGDENKYSKWLYKHWGKIKSICFAGFMSHKKLYEYYKKSDCLIFPSRIETWGLPISEFSAFEKPMLLADLPYAHETAAGCQKVAFFNTSSPIELKEQMKRLIGGDSSFLLSVQKKSINPPLANTWQDLFEQLLS